MRSLVNPSPIALNNFSVLHPGGMSHGPGAALMVQTVRPSQYGRSRSGVALSSQSDPKFFGPVQSEDAFALAHSVAGSDGKAQSTTNNAIAEESVLAASTGDLPTYDDNRFEPYVQAVADFCYKLLLSEV
jgi:hypothetical protein